jgi:plasmid rolling circle replication initiator protein Rep
MKTINQIPVGIKQKLNFFPKSATLPKASKSSASFSLDTVAQMNIEDVDADVFSRYLTKQLKRSVRLKERRECKKAFVIKLRKYGYTEEAENLEKCSANFTSLVCESGHSFRPIVDFRCHLPFCPDCWELKSNRELRRNLPKFHQALKDNPSLIVAFNTLTLRSDKKRDLRSGCREIKSDFRKLRKRDIWENCEGGFGRIENTYSKKHSWHPHLHCLLLLNDYIPQKALSENWKDITGDSMIVDIRTVRDVSAGLVECIKYPFKPADLRKLGKAQIAEMMELKGERLGLSFGNLFGLEVDDETESEMQDEYAEFADETKELEVGDDCPICGSRLDLVDFSADSYASFLGCVPISTKARGRPL